MGGTQSQGEGGGRGWGGGGGEGGERACKHEMHHEIGGDGHKGTKGEAKCCISSISVC